MDPTPIARTTMATKTPQHQPTLTHPTLPLAHPGMSEDPTINLLPQPNQPQSPTPAEPVRDYVPPATPKMTSPPTAEASTNAPALPSPANNHPPTAEPTGQAPLHRRRLIDATPPRRTSRTNAGTKSKFLYENYILG